MTNAQSLTLKLGGKWYGDYGVACCPAHPDHKPSLSIRDGDDGKLLAYCHAGCNFADVIAAVGKDFTLPPSMPFARDQAERWQKYEARGKMARKVWAETQEIEGTLAETYLRERGIEGRICGHLRFHPDCWHPSAKRFPALVARLLFTKSGFAIHRTYLSLDGRTKADIDPPRAMLGSCGGGSVYLRGGKIGDPHIVAEGIETALSVPFSGQASVYATLSTSGLRSFRLPSTDALIDDDPRLIIAVDGDQAGRAAAVALAERADLDGWRVEYLFAPEGKDWNDILLEGRK